MNKSSSLLLHLYLHLFHFLIMNKSSYFNKKKKKKDKIFKKGLGTRGIRLVLLWFLSKKIQNFQFLEKIQDSSKKNPNFQFLEKIQDSSKKKIQIFNSLKKFKISKFFKKKNQNKNFQFLLKI